MKLSRLHINKVFEDSPGCPMSRCPKYLQSKSVPFDKPQIIQLRLTTPALIRIIESLLERIVQSNEACHQPENCNG